MKKLSYSVVIIACALIACKSSEKASKTESASNPAPASTVQYTYAEDIKPIMEAYCTKCHNKNEKAGYNLMEESFVKKAGANGYLLGSIKHAEGYDSMPAGGAAKLDDTVIAKIEQWIKGGMN